MFTVIVQETKPLNGAPSGDDPVVERYRQCVDSVDIAKIIAAVNSKPRAPRKAKVAKP